MNRPANIAKEQTASSSGNANAISPDKWRDILYEAAAEVFSMMVGAEISPQAKPAELSPPKVTGTVGIAGALSAILTLRCSTDSATRIASQMLGVPMQEAAAHHCDAIGEVCNIVAGHFKAKIGMGASCMLSMPTVIVGGDYQLHSLAAGERLDLPLHYEGEPLWIALDIRK